MVNHENILIFHGEDEFDRLVHQVKMLLLGKIAFQKLVIGLDPGVATGMVVIADGKVIEAGNCFRNKELITSIFKMLRNVNFEVTSVSTKIGNGVPFYKEMLGRFR